MIEIWKDYKAYGKLDKALMTYFEVSNLGNVKVHIYRYKECHVNLIKIIRDRRCVGSERHQIFRLVWEAFNGPVPEGYVVHHIDENKLNDRLDNLMLMTKEEHCAHHRKGNKAALNRKWYNNGINSKMILEGDIVPEGYVEGRIKWKN